MHRLADTRGFTMVELLVVILIIGILALIALPAFMSQRLRGQDSEATQMARVVALTLETYRTDHDDYDATREELEEIEPAITEASADLSVTGVVSSYEITETSVSGTTFTLAHEPDGSTRRSCDTPGRGMCRSDNTW